MFFGYVRVSTAEQNLDAQFDALRASGAERIFSEKLPTSMTTLDVRAYVAKGLIDRLFSTRGGDDGLLAGLSPNWPPVDNASRSDRQGAQTQIWANQFQDSP